MANGWIILRVAVWLPLIFILSYLAVGAAMAVLAAIWPYLLGAVAIGVLFVVAAVVAS